MTFLTSLKVSNSREFLDKKWVFAAVCYVYFLLIILSSKPYGYRKSQSLSAPDPHLPRELFGILS